VPGETFLTFLWINGADKRCQEKRSELSWALRSYGRARGEKERTHRNKVEKVSPGTVLAPF